VNKITKEQVLADVEAATKEAMIKAKEILEDAKIKVKVIERIPVPGYRFLHAGGYKCDATVTYEVNTRAEAVAIYSKMPGVPLALVRDSCVAIMAKERVEKKIKAKITSLSRFVFKLDKLIDYPRTAKLWWVHKLGDLLVSVNVEIKNDPSYYVLDKIRDVRNRIIESKWIAIAKLEGSVWSLRFWAPEKSPNPHVYYWAPSAKADKVIVG
jgi:hypothetical protein